MERIPEYTLNTLNETCKLLNETKLVEKDVGPVSPP